MSIEQNRKVILKYAQSVWNERDYGVADEVISEKFAHHSLDIKGPEGIKRDIAGLHKTFPDAKWELLDTVAEGDKVTLRFRFSGTHQGRFLGIEPTGKLLQFDAIDIFRLEDGKIVEEWAVLDFVTALRQMGAI